MKQEFFDWGLSLLERGVSRRMIRDLAIDGHVVLADLRGPGCVRRFQVSVNGQPVPEPPLASDDADHMAIIFNAHIRTPDTPLRLTYATGTAVALSGLEIKPNEHGIA